MTANLLVPTENFAFARGGNHGINNNNDSNNSNNNNDVIAIQVIQPTPNVSPTCSLRSFSVEGPDIISPPQAEGTSSTRSVSSNPPSPSISLPPMSSTPPTSSSLKRKSAGAAGALGGGGGKVDRRVSFSEDSTEEKSSQHQHQYGMTYLQVPGQSGPLQLTAPSTISVEAQMAQTSPQARKRRQTRLMKTGSFCSINSEGDSSSDVVDVVDKHRSSGRQQPSRGDSGDSVEREIMMARMTGNNKRFEPLTDYTEFQGDDCKSDISELFIRGDRRSSDVYAPSSQGTLSEQGSLDSDEAANNTVVIMGKKNKGGGGGGGGKPYNNPEYDEIMLKHHEEEQQLEEETEDEEEEEDEDDDDELAREADDEIDYASSSCSISMTSDCAPANNNNAHHSGSAAAPAASGPNHSQITVPVTIEHPPPELRVDCLLESEAGGGGGASALPSCSSSSTAATTVVATLGTNNKRGLTRQETGHTDSGLETEDILPAPVAQEQQPQQQQPPQQHQGQNLLEEQFLLGEVDPETGLRMVLVRDIGVQVYGDSPSLNSTRRIPQGQQLEHKNFQTSPSPPSAASAASKSNRDETSFQPEVLF